MGGVDGGRIAYMNGWGDLIGIPAADTRIVSFMITTKFRWRTGLQRNLRI